MKTLRLVSIIIFSLLCSGKVFAQIKFEHGTFTEIKAKAKVENKLIFMDCYTSWCGPCKWMAKTVFTNDTVAGYFNEHFICVQFDMEEGEGIELAKRFVIHSYPTFIFSDAQGNMVHRFVGARPAKDFLACAQNALIPEKTYSAMVKMFEGGTRDAVFMAKYIDATDQAGLDTKEIVKDYFATQKESDLISPINWRIIYWYQNDYDSKEFAYLLKNTDAFAKKYTLDSVNNKIFALYYNACNRLIYSRNADSTDYLPLKEKIKETGFARTEELLLTTDMSYYEKKQDYENFAKAAAEYIDKYNNNDANMLNNISYDFYTNIKDKAMLAKAEQWAKKGYELDPHPQYSMDTYACVLSVNGKKQEAIKLEKQAIELIKADPKKYSQDTIPGMEKKIADWSK